MDVTTASPALISDGPRTAVLFDLDGTLVDPAGGITGGIEHALGAMGLPIPADEVLNAMIGPKLADGLVSIIGVPPAKVDGVIAAYRQWYGEQGMAMSVVYPGVRELLVQLKSDGVPLAVATQKPEPLAKKLLAHHGLAELFQVIRGSHADETLMPGDPGYRPGKAEIIAAALSALAALSSGAPAGTAAAPTNDAPAPFGAVMVGDRHQDVLGARSNGLGCIGVSWGFAAEGELAAAGVAALVHTAGELAAELARTDGAAGSEVSAVAAVVDARVVDAPGEAARGAL